MSRLGDEGGGVENWTRVEDEMKWISRGWMGVWSYYKKDGYLGFG